MTERHCCNWTGCDAVFIGGSEPKDWTWILTGTDADDQERFLCGDHAEALARLLKD